MEVSELSGGEEGWGVDGSHLCWQGRREDGRVREMEGEVTLKTVAVMLDGFCV